MSSLQNLILQPLLYYDIFDHPLTVVEILKFLPANTVSLSDIQVALAEMILEGKVEQSQGFYSLAGKTTGLSQQRLQKQQYARKLWMVARVVTHVLKRFPFVRAVIISGDLSKNVADKNSDIDFFVITENRRLWICRGMLTLFKKVFLLNSKKFFCINYYVSVEHMEVQERNIYTATEIAHLQPTYNEDLFYKFEEANSWVRDFFPNFRLQRNGHHRRNGNSSLLRSVLEIPFRGRWADRLDTRLMVFMKEVWKERYPLLSEEQRDKMFRCRPYESRAHGGNFEEKVLTAYAERLRSCGISQIEIDSSGGLRSVDVVEESQR